MIALVIAVPAAWLFARWMPWPIAVLFLVAQLAYCATTRALDDWAYSLIIGALTFYEVWGEAHWDGALAAASALSAAFIGWRRYGRTGRPLLGDERD